MALVLRDDAPRYIATVRSSRAMSTRKLVRHLVWLESFTAAVEAGSLEGAAEHLGVARSVVSEHLRALEDALSGGEPLLARGPGRRQIGRAHV